MRFNTRFLATAETKAFFEELGITEIVKESADGVCELRAAASSKLQALKETIDERDPILAVKEKVAQICYGYIESMDNSDYIDITVEARSLFKEIGLNIEVRLSAGDVTEVVRFEYLADNADPELSSKLVKFFPVARVLTKEASPLYSSEMKEALIDFAVGEQVYAKVKRNADQGKEIKKAAKVLLEKFDPKKNSVVDLIIQGEKDAVNLIKKAVSISKPIDFEVTRYQISSSDFSNSDNEGPSGKGYQSVINFAAGGLSAHFVISALLTEGYRKEVVLYAVVINGRANGKVTGYFKPEWIRKDLPGRTEEEFKKVMADWGLRHAKGGIEKKYNDIASALNGYRIEKKEEMFVAIKKIEMRLDYPGRGDTMEMDTGVHKKIEDSLKAAASLSKSSNVSLNIDAGYDEVDYYDGCNSYDVPSYTIKNNVYSHYNRQSNDTPKGWIAELYIRIEIPINAKVDKLQAIAERLETVEVELPRPMPRFSGFGTPRW